MHIRQQNRGTRAFADDSGLSLVASVLGLGTDSVMPVQWGAERLTEAEIEARSIAFGVVRQMAFDLQEAFDRRAGIRTSSDGNSFTPNDLPELLSWIFDEDFYFAPTMPLSARRGDPDRRDLTWHVCLPDDGLLTFTNCSRLLRLDVVACRESIQAWLDGRAHGIYTDSLIRVEGGTASVHQRRTRAAERFRKAGMPEDAVRIAMTRTEEPKPKPTGRTRHWRKKPRLFWSVTCSESGTGTDDALSAELPTVPPIELGPMPLSPLGSEFA